jgi:hypothetical protein
VRFGAECKCERPGVHVGQPLDRLLDMDTVLSFPQDHFAGVTFDADIEPLAAHRVKLYAHQSLDDHGGFPPRFLRSSPVIGSNQNLT